MSVMEGVSTGAGVFGSPLRLNLVKRPSRGRGRGGLLQALGLVIEALSHLVKAGEGSEPDRALPQVTQPLDRLGGKGDLNRLILGLEAGDSLQEGTLLGQLGHLAQLGRGPGKGEIVDQGLHICLSP